MNKMAGKEDVPATSRIKIVCKFCNAIIGCEKGSTDLFCQHLEESHNIFQNQDMVLALQFLSETQRSELMKITRGAIRETLKVGHDGEEEDEKMRDKYLTIQGLRLHQEAKTGLLIY